MLGSASMADNGYCATNMGVFAGKAGRPTVRSQQTEIYRNRYIQDYTVIYRNIPEYTEIYRY